MHQVRPASAGWVAAALALTVTLGLGACSGSEKSPAEARRDRVQARLRTSFSAPQARCIITRADGDVMKALDRSTDLSPKSKVMTEYSDLIVACVTDPNGTTTTTASTTSAPSSVSATSTSTTEP